MNQYNSCEMTKAPKIREKKKLHHEGYMYVFDRASTDGVSQFIGFYCGLVNIHRYKIMYVISDYTFLGL